MKVEEELSAEGREIFRAIERERQEAWQAGVQGDWWGGERRKGVGAAELQVCYGARRLLVASAGGADSEDDDDGEGEEDGVAGSRGADIGGIGEGGREPPEPVSMDEDKGMREPPEPVSMDEDGGMYEPPEPVSMDEDTDDEEEGDEEDWMNEME